MAVDRERLGSAQAPVRTYTLGHVSGTKSLPKIGPEPKLR